MSEFWMRYVPHSLVSAYEALGWRVTGTTPGHHGVYAQNMRWDGEGQPPIPQAAQTKDLAKDMHK